MSTGNMRRAQLVTPFGVGAMSVLVNGTSVVTAGLDHWYEADEASTLAMEEYQEHDWRLEARLRVSEFRLPPDYRYQGGGSDQRNVKLTVPVLRLRSTRTNRISRGCRRYLLLLYVRRGTSTISPSTTGFIAPTPLLVLGLCAWFHAAVVGWRVRS